MRAKIAELRAPDRRFPQGFLIAGFGPDRYSPENGLLLTERGFKMGARRIEPVDDSFFSSYRVPVFGRGLDRGLLGALGRAKIDTEVAKIVAGKGDRVYVRSRLFGGPRTYRAPTPFEMGTD